MKNFNDSNNSALYVTGCLHLGHNPRWDNPLWKMRGYNSAEEMTYGIIDRINQICRPSDILLVLGDLCLNTSSEKLQEYLDRIQPKIWLLYGNHNSPIEHPLRENCQVEYGFDLCVPYKYWMGQIDILGHYLEFNWNRQFTVFNHYAYQVWNKSHHGSWSLCSHSHGTLPTILPDCKNGKQLDCGWDVHGKPLSFSDIKEIMDKKEIFSLDRH